MLCKISDKAVECLLEAEKCRENAKVAKTPQEKAFYIRMEQRYMSLASSWQWLDCAKVFTRR